MTNTSLFLIGCIGVRSLLAFTAYYLSNNPSEKNSKLLNILAIVAILIGIGFLTIFITGLRKTGIETGGEKIWWNRLRPVFGLIWLAFGITALKGVSWCWLFLLADVILGLSSFIVQHYL